MNPKYEFISAWREQMMAAGHQNLFLKNSQLGVRAKLFLKLGDVLINSGSWLKRAAHSSVEKNAMSLYTQNT
jgi:hypothetical protein